MCTFATGGSITQTFAINLEEFHNEVSVNWSDISHSLQKMKNTCLLALKYRLCGRFKYMFTLFDV